MGQIIDQLYRLKNRVRALERFNMLLFIALVLLSLGDMLRMIDRWMK